MSNQIDIKIEAKKLTPEKFLEGVKEFFALIQGVSKNITGASLEWDVEVEKSSRCVRMRELNPTRNSEIAIETVCRGIRALRNGIVAIPEGFTRAEVRSAKILSELSDGCDVQSVLMRNGGPPEDLTHIIAEVAEKILEGQSRIAFGSIEGVIVSLSARHGLTCTIDDKIHHREIVCYLQNEEVQKLSVDGYTKRVIASGLIHYAKEGNAVSITADKMRIFKPDSELPTVEDIQAIYKKYK